MQALPKVYLHPGEMLFTRDDCHVVTVLGSCVAVTLFSRRVKAAAICHVTLPDMPVGQNVAARDADRFRYASETIPEMISRFRAIGARPGEIEARIFGGSSRLWPDGEQSVYAVGRTNLERVRQLLEDGNVPVLQQDVGSSGSLRVVFDTRAGQTIASRSAAHPLTTKPPTS